MVKLYVMKIKDKNFEFEYSNVPYLWKTKVLVEFKRQVEDGEITEEEYKEYIGEEYAG